MLIMVVDFLSTKPPPPKPISAMLSALFNTITTILNSSNLAVWQRQMKAYLQADGTWYTVAAYPSNHKDKDWVKDNSRAIRSITLWCAPTIQERIKAVQPTLMVKDEECTIAIHTPRPTTATDNKESISVSPAGA
jgi:hypothetical protein